MRADEYVRAVFAKHGRNPDMLYFWLLQKLGALPGKAQDLPLLKIAGQAMLEMAQAVERGEVSLSETGPKGLVSDHCALDCCVRLVREAVETTMVELPIMTPVATEIIAISPWWRRFWNWLVRLLSGS